MVVVFEVAVVDVDVFLVVVLKVLVVVVDVVFKIVVVVTMQNSENVWSS